MSQVDLYLNAAERPNTRRSYESALKHFEIEWGGLLPASIDSVSRYLAAYAESLSLNTLKHRLAALSRWHQDHGFPDPTKATKIRQLLKGIRTLHPAQEKRAKPLELETLQSVSNWLSGAATAAKELGNTSSELRHTRNRALLLLGFWRGFRSDELSSLQIEFIDLKPGEGISCYLPRSKVDRQMDGRTFSCPALSRLCPVEAVDEWLKLSQLKSGPLFRKIDRWGHLVETELLPGSIIPMLRQLLRQAGMDDAEAFSSHSLRRGFAHWASQSGWDIRELMGYVGWRDIKAAMRYLDGAEFGTKQRFEQGLGQIPPHSSVSPEKSPVQLPALSKVVSTVIEVSIQLSPFDNNSKGKSKAIRDMEETCLARFKAIRLESDGSLYRISVPTPSVEVLDDHLYELLDELHQIADARECFLEVVCRDPMTGKHWD